MVLLLRFSDCIVPGHPILCDQTTCTLFSALRLIIACLLSHSLPLSRNKLKRQTNVYTFLNQVLLIQTLFISKNDESLENNIYYT